MKIRIEKQWEGLPTHFDKLSLTDEFVIKGVLIKYKLLKLI